MSDLLRIAAAIGIALSTAALWRSRSFLHGTTLDTAWRWSATATVGWIIALATSFPLLKASAGERDPFWFAAAVLTLCPAIAVLGARRPGARVWTWFVLFPLLLVFALSAVTAGGMFGGGGDLRLETPMLVGYVLISLMGCGNYLLTKYAIPALLLLAALIVTAVSFSENPFGLRLNGSRENWHLIAAAGVSAAILSGWWIARRTSKCGVGIHRVWGDFVNTFGIVWARRVLEGVNRTAAEEKWPARLEVDGLRWTDSQWPPADDRSRTLQRFENTLKRRLKRFVDGAWIADRMLTEFLPRA